MLIEPIPVLPVHELGAAHFIAAGGAGMSGIAQLFAESGVRTSGSDQADSSALRALSQAGVTTHVGHCASQVGDVDVVVVSSAIKPQNVELAEANERGIPVWHRSAALASLMQGREGVCITGTHGKTTTTGMTAVMLAAAGLDPSYVIGSPLAATGLTAHLGSGAPFVVEADESDGSFLQYPTAVAVVTNIEADHLDNWGTADEYAAGFRTFATAAGVRVLVAGADDPGSVALADEVRAAGHRVVTFGESPDSDVRLTDLTYEGTAAHATLVSTAGSHELRLRVPGRFNLHNAAAAFAVGCELGADPTLLIAGAAEFAGTLRRFQPVGEVDRIRLFDDYAHHPTEVAATLTAARDAAGTGRVVACFQPHLYSRTRDFAEEFGRALALADVAVVTDVYGAREQPLAGITGELVADAAMDAGALLVTYVPKLDDVPAVLAAVAQPGDVILTLGAGSITRVGPETADILARGGR